MTVLLALGTLFILRTVFSRVDRKSLCLILLHTVTLSLVANHGRPVLFCQKSEVLWKLKEGKWQSCD